MSLKFQIAFGVAMMVAALPLQALPRGDEPVAVPRAIQQGIDFVYVDPAMGTVARLRQRPQNWLERMQSVDRLAPLDGPSDPNPLFLELAQGLEQYQSTWGRLPQIAVPAGTVLKEGANGPRVDLLRARLGLTPRGGYDGEVVEAVMAYQAVHGLGNPDGITGNATVASLNLGAEHYAQRIAINVERAYRLPLVNKFDRYVVVDSGAAEARLFDDDLEVDRMRVVVGAPKSMTPMMAVLMRSAKANPYWNVPPDLIQSLTAKRVSEQGLSYLRNFNYEVLSDWSANPKLLDPETVDWDQVAQGKSPVRVRQVPGPWNAMGNMKFEMPNDYGIYLHDTPQKEVFSSDNRWISNGCVRLEDYRRFATWVFGAVPEATSGREEKFDLPRPVPIYLTYLTVGVDANGIVFRPDPYGLDALTRPQMFGGESKANAALVKNVQDAIPGQLEAM